jgi:hypothetical protein
MKNIGRYEQAALTLTGPVEDLVGDRAVYSILDTAHQVDNLIFTIAEDSRRLSQNFAEFATTLVEVNYDVTPPTRSSLIADITENTGRLRAKREALFTLITTLRGRDALKAFSQALS